jgi:hypothetical protein
LGGGVLSAARVLLVPLDVMDEGASEVGSDVEEAGADADREPVFGCSSDVDEEEVAVERLNEERHLELIQKKAVKARRREAPQGLLVSNSGCVLDSGSGTGERRPGQLAVLRNLGSVAAALATASSATTPTASVQLSSSACAGRKTRSFCSIPTQTWCLLMVRSGPMDA